jgi:hypothetical protein
MKSEAHNHPKHLLRPRGRSHWNAKQRAGFAVKTYERQNEPAKITLPTPPWEENGEDEPRREQTYSR